MRRNVESSPGSDRQACERRTGNARAEISRLDAERGNMAYFFNEENEPNYVPNRTGKGAGYLDNKKAR